MKRALALTLLRIGRIGFWNRRLADGQVIPALSGANLSGANLSGANLSGAELSEADLSGANLTATNLTGANLNEANLTGANLTGANLTRANLTAANLTGANLTAAELSEAEVTDAIVARSIVLNLRWTSIQGKPTPPAVVYLDELRDEAKALTGKKASEFFAAKERVCLEEIPSPDADVDRPSIIIAWSPELISEKDYSRLVTALGDLMRAEGGLGVERVGSIGFEVPVEVGVPA